MDWKAESVKRYLPIGMIRKMAGPGRPSRVWNTPATDPRRRMQPACRDPGELDWGNSLQLDAIYIAHLRSTPGTENAHTIPRTPLPQLLDILFLLAKRIGTLGAIVRIAFFAVRPTLGRFSGYDSTFCTFRLWQDSITPISGTIGRDGPQPGAIGQLLQ